MSETLIKTLDDAITPAQKLMEKVSDSLPEMSSTQKAAAAAGLGIAVAAAGVMVHKVRKGSADGGNSEDGIDNVFHLEPEGESWVLTQEGTAATRATFDTKEEGLEAARILAKNHTPSELVIHLMDGSEQRRHRYGLE